MKILSLFVGPIIRLLISKTDTIHLSLCKANYEGESLEWIGEKNRVKSKVPGMKNYRRTFLLQTPVCDLF